MDTLWKLFIICWVALVAVSCGAGVGSLFRTASHHTTTYNTTHWEFNILSGNADTVAVIGICAVLVLVLRSLRGGGGQ